MDQVTVPRELLRRAYAEILHLSRMANADRTERSIIGELRTALEQPAVEPAPCTPKGWLVQVRPDGVICISAPNPRPGESTKTCCTIRASDKSDLAVIMRKYFAHALEQPAPQAQQPAPVREPCSRLCELCIKRGYDFCANAVVTTQIPNPQPAPVQEPDNLQCKTVQKRLATQWGYVEAQQPRKVVKLTPEEMKAAVEHAWGPARIDAAIEMYGHEYRAIEQAVWEKLGVTE